MKTLNHNIIHIFIFGIWILSVSCNSQAVKEQQNTAYQEGALMDMALSPEGDAGLQTTDRKLIRNASLTFETDDLMQAQQNIHKALDSFGAYTTSENQYNTDEQITISMTIRVPALNFDSLIAFISEGAKLIDEKNIQITDITEQYIDTEARLNNKKALENRYVELLKKAASVKEILEIEKELASVRADIESMTGTLNLFNKQIDYSLITINFYQKIEKGHAFGKKLTEGLEAGWNNLVWFFIGLIHIWPFILLFSGVIWIMIRYKKRNNQKKQDIIQKKS